MDNIFLKNRKPWGVDIYTKESKDGPPSISITKITSNNKTFGKINYLQRIHYWIIHANMLIVFPKLSLWIPCTKKVKNCDWIWDAYVESIVTQTSSTQSTQRSLCSTGITPYVIRWANGHSFQPAWKWAT